MSRCLLCALVGLALSPAAAAQDEIRRGKLAKVDAAAGIVTIAADGKSVDLVVTPATRFVGTDGEALKGLADDRLRAGAAVAFRAEERGGKRVLVGLRLVEDGGGDGDIRRAKVRKIDLEKRLITLTVDGKDRDFVLTEATRVLDAPGKDLAERLRRFKEGAAVQFKAAARDGKDVLVALRLADPGKGNPPDRPRADTSKLRPLTELGAAKYQEFEGGLYPGGKNDRPAAHEAAGVALAKQVQPLAADGKPSAAGKVVLLSVGMSNTSQASQGFQKALAGDRDLSPRVLFVNGAVGGMTAAVIQDPNDGGRGTKYWETVDQRLKAAGATRAQVQAVWIKQADAGPTQGFPAYAKKLQGELANIVKALAARFPNVKLVYLSSRTFGGYARTGLNPEPYAYESAFAVRWLIEQQLAGDPALNHDPAKGAVRAPWLSWGPYLWANGTTKRADGFFYEEGDFVADGTHLSPSGMEKVGRLMLQFFRADATARPWFVAQVPPGR